MNTSTFAFADVSSQNRSHYRNIISRALVASGRTVYPRTPKAIDVGGDPAVASISNPPVVPESLSIVIPLHVTPEVGRKPIAAGVK